MNNLIKQLAEQAKAQYCDLGDASCFKRLGLVEAVVFTPEDLEKFAQLIVRECGVALSPMLRDMVSCGQAFDLIKRHFGVE
jgi:hypothetical protein